MPLRASNLSDYNIEARSNNYANLIKRSQKEQQKNPEEKNRSTKFIHNDEAAEVKAII